MEGFKYSEIAVIGLGNFGRSVVETLSKYDVNILAVDKDPVILGEISELATNAVQADALDEHALCSLELENYDAVIIAMGDDFEAAIISTMIAKEQGAKNVIVKARGLRQKQILERVGADSVVLPEHDMGHKIAAGLVGYNIVDMIEQSDHYQLSKLIPQPEWVGRTVRDADIRHKDDMYVLAILREGKMIAPVGPDVVLLREDVLVVMEER